jgi:uncharacterized YigZ family protein
MVDYRIPTTTVRIEIEVIKSRFIATAGFVPTVDDTKAFLAAVRAEMPDASHHVYAFRVGFGNSVNEGLSDDGEPSGTSGPPVMAVLRGSGIGDLIIVVTRYFGGTKLGTGGLVRAYSDAAREVLHELPTALKIEKVLLGIDLPYPLYELTLRLIEAHHGMVEDTTFAGDVTVLARFPVKDADSFNVALRDLSAGRVTPVELERG